MGIWSDRCVCVCVSECACLTFALCVQQDVLFEGCVSGVGEGLWGELREALLEVGSLLRRPWNTHTHTHTQLSPSYTVYTHNSA